MSDQDQIDITRQVTNIVVNNLEYIDWLREDLRKAKSEREKTNLLDAAMSVFCKIDGCSPMVKDFVSVAKLYINWSEVQRRLETGR